MGCVLGGSVGGAGMLPQHLPLWIQAGRGRGQPDPFTLRLGQGPGLYMRASLSKGRPSRGSQHCWCPDPRAPQMAFPARGAPRKSNHSTRTNSQFSGFTKKSDTSMSSEAVKSMFCPFEIQAFTGRRTLGDPLTRPGLRFSLLENGAVMVPAAQMSLEIP